MMKKQPPGGNGGPDDGDDQQHAIGGEALRRALLHARDDEVVDDLPEVRVAEDDQGDDEQVAEQDDEHEPFPRLETTRDGDPDEEHAGERHGEIRGDTEVRGTEGDADELGSDGEEVEDDEVADGEPSPEPTEALEDQ